MLRTLLVPLDGSPLSERVLTTAAVLARSTGATVDLARVHVPLAYGDLADAERWERAARREERDYLQRTADRLATEFDVRATSALLEEPVASAICHRAADVGADLVVMATHGRTGFSRAWLGGIADAVARHATLPVLMVRAESVTAALREGARAPDAWISEPPLALQRVLVPLDGSGLAEQIIGHAIALARAVGASLHLLRVVEPVVVRAVEYPLFYALPIPVVDDEALAMAVESARQYLAAVASRASAVDSLKVEAEVVVADHAAPAIIDAAWAHHADVVALATHGRGASRLLRGSVADKVLRAGPAAVLCFRPIQD